MSASFVEHAIKGAAFGAFLGASVASAGWVVRQRNAAPIDLGEVEAPVVLARHRPLAETLLEFKQISHHTASTRALYAQLVRECELVVANGGATGGVAQVTVQRRVLHAAGYAKRLVGAALRSRDPRAYDCRATIETLEGHLGAVLKNMLIG